MSHAKNKVEWCLNKAQKELQSGKQHRGLVKTDADIEKARGHLAKAEHNLKATLYLQRGGYSDWCSSSLFYAIYHCFLAILAKFGYETRNKNPNHSSQVTGVRDFAIAKSCGVFLIFFGILSFTIASRSKLLGMYPKKKSRMHFCPHRQPHRG